MVMAVGFPLSLQAAQPECSPVLPHPSKTRHHRPPHILPPQLPQFNSLLLPA